MRSGVSCVKKSNVGELLHYNTYAVPNIGVNLFAHSALCSDRRVTVTVLLVGPTPWIATWLGSKF